MTPLFDQIFFREKDAEVTAPQSGIIITSVADSNDVKQGEVIAVGPDVEHVEPGDIIHLNWKEINPGTSEDGTRGAFIKEKNVLGIVNR